MASRSPFECLAFVVGEVELFEHLLDSALDLEEVEGVAGAGGAVGALGEEVVAACSAYRFQEWPEVQGPAGSPCLRALPASPSSRPVPVPAERDGHRCWLVGGRKPGPNRPTQPAWNWTLPEASRTVTFAER